MILNTRPIANSEFRLLATLIATFDVAVPALISTGLKVIEALPSFFTSSDKRKVCLRSACCLSILTTFKGEGAVGSWGTLFVTFEGIAKTFAIAVILLIVTTKLVDAFIPASLSVSVAAVIAATVATDLTEWNAFLQFVTEVGSDRTSPSCLFICKN